MIHPTFILVGDKVGDMTVIFKQHTADGEGLAEKEGVPSNVLQGGSNEEPKISRQLQVLLGKNHLLFVVEIYLTFTFSSFVFGLYMQQSGPADSTTRRPVQIDHGKGATTGRYTRKKKCYTLSGPQADKLLRSRPSSPRRRLPFNN